MSQNLSELSGIVFSQGLKVDNSSLTGECIPVSRTAECTSDNALESKNVAFFSTFAVEGTGKGLVIYTGNRTVPLHFFKYNFIRIKIKFKKTKNHFRERPESL
jgi:hypothetical protein